MMNERSAVRRASLPLDDAGEEVFTYGDFSPDDHEIAETAETFLRRDVVPRLVPVLALAISFLTFAHFATQSVKYLTGHNHQFGLVRLFNLAGENNIPNWYASSTLLVCTILLAMIGRVKKQLGVLYARHWLILAAIFLGLSLDESASIHEMTNAPLHHVLHTTRYLYFAWVIGGGVFGSVVLLAYLPFLAALPVKTRYLFLISGALYVGGALGIEVIEGNYRYIHGPGGSLTYSSLVGLEETLEMIGVASFMYSLASYLVSDLDERRRNAGADQSIEATARTDHQPLRSEMLRVS